MGFIETICLILGGGTAAALIAWGLYNVKQPDYDERQKIVSGNSYRLALFTLVIFQVIFGVVDRVLDGLPVERPLGQVFGLLLSVGALVVYRVSNDAFFTRRQRPWIWSWTFAVLALVCTAASVYICHTVGFVREGRLSLAALIPVLGLFHMILWIVTALKLCREKRRERVA